MCLGAQAAQADDAPEEVVEEASEAFDLAEEYIEEFSDGRFRMKLVCVSPSVGLRSPSCDGIRRGVRSPLPKEIKDFLRLLWKVFVLSFQA